MPVLALSALRDTPNVSMSASEMISRAFYGPPDYLVLRTNARLRRAINFWMLVVWLVPGTVLFVELRNAVWFLSFMSIYAIWVSHGGSFSAETPVEKE